MAQAPEPMAAQTNRCRTGGLIDRDRPLAFTFNGRHLTGYAGDTLASALLANGVDIVGRSFKYSRARGIFAAGVEEPNAILQLGASPGRSTPNVRATEQPLFDGLICRSVNGWPSTDTDLMSLVGRVGGAAMGPGFYYKTFMSPASLWMSYERLIRKAAGLGRAPSAADPDCYDHMHHHADVLIVGGGPAGLSAALAASAGNRRVVLCELDSEPGGSLLGDTTTTIDGRPAADWVAAACATLAQRDTVTVMTRATVTGWHDHNFLTVFERRSDHLGSLAPVGVSRHRLHKIRAHRVILASGAHERPLVFANNDLPGCMLASAVSRYIRRYAVVPGKRLVVMTSNDAGYDAAFAWQDAGREVVCIVDTRASATGDVHDAARQRGLSVRYGSAVIEARGSRRVTGALVSTINAHGNIVTSDPVTLDCDTLASAGGWSPVVHLSCHTGARPVWRDDVIGFVPVGREDALFAGSVNGSHALADCLREGTEAGSHCAGTADAVTTPIAERPTEAPAMPLFLVPHQRTPSRAPKQFVDLQNDVTAAGIETACREGFESIEHVKRYTAMGFGTDQGKTGNINGMAIVAHALQQSIPETGTTVFRPNYTPVSFGAMAGAHTGPLFDPKRFTPLHGWHLEHGAEFENVGQWKRPWYYPKPGEDLHAAVHRECLAVREGVGILDASTLGKIDIQGPDAREFLGRIYTNAWARLAPGRCRYGLMCGEDGMVFDDGVTACLGDTHFHMTTTTGGAARVLAWLELYHQTEWPELDVFFNSVTDHWATISIAGPASRTLLAELCDDIDLGAEAFGFMDWRAGHVAGVPARVFRISFTGELSYEINVPADFAAHVWQALMAQGADHGITPYGTETMHVLRAEKGFIIVGQDTDGSVTPADLGMQWCVADNKPFSFVGKRGMRRADCLREDRKQLVGLETHDPAVVLPEGAQAVDDPHQPIPMRMIGHVTSSYHSPVLGRSIALGLIRGGRARIGQTIHFPLADGRQLAATIRDSVFFDPDNTRQA